MGVGALLACFIMTHFVESAPWQHGVVQKAYRLIADEQIALQPLGNLKHRARVLSSVIAVEAVVRRRKGRAPVLRLRQMCGTTGERVSGRGVQEGGG
jgi:hypothetical protein